MRALGQCTGLLNRSAISYAACSLYIAVMVVFLPSFRFAFGLFANSANPGVFCSRTVFHPFHPVGFA